MHLSLRRRVVAVTLLSACLAFALLTLTPPAGAVELRFDPSHAKAPPQVASASIELLPRPTAAGNAVVRMQFADKRRNTALVIQGGLGPTPLRDDGAAPDTRAADGVYAAVVQVDAAQVNRIQQQRIERLSKYRALPVFGPQRELLRHEPPAPSRFTALEAGRASPLDKISGIPFVVDPARELLITSTLVVEDPLRTYDACSGNGTQMGAWTFGKLMTEMANEPVTGIHPADFAEWWVNQWQNDLSINGFTVPNRAIGLPRLLDNWPRLGNGKLDLARAPFRLLAIVNRQDLRGNTLYGSGDAGEARLVFGALNCKLAGPPFIPQAMPFTVIFEYGIRRNGCFAVRDWARQWRALGSLALGSPAYNTALQALTDQFTLRDADPSKLPNRSAINQVRTNEFALGNTFFETFWQLRESKLQLNKGPFAGRLMHDTVAQTPDRSLQNSPAVGDFVNQHESAILAGKHEVPLTYPGTAPFRGGHIDPGAGFIWSPPGVTNPEARHMFSLATCSGCHTGSTDTGFLHIKPRMLGAEAKLSDFLTGNNMPKNIDGVQRTFHDLLDRQARLEATAGMSCLKPIDFPIEEIFLEPLKPAFAH
ncbi:choice-of-anchor X domain-containing protein [Methylibium rhizosphaerae]|uniref:choice-of-anchor X domain-containing protein n=1 Tax=Methylibium rhizosphaerae TaxID=2570323 RepID=UPI00112E92CA|nr:choice-of-anchor X domain-containing protein [Methylibium rhizosphaerae]